MHHHHHRRSPIVVSRSVFLHFAFCLRCIYLSMCTVHMCATCILAAHNVCIYSSNICVCVCVFVYRMFIYVYILLVYK